MSDAQTGRAQVTASPPRADVWLPLLRETLAREGRFRFPLRGDSMRPTLPAACEIEIVPLVGTPARGSLIVFANGDTLVAHRYVRRAGHTWIAHGDARLAPDAPLDLSQVLGVVAAAYVDGRRVWPGRLSSLAAPFWVARHHVLRIPRALLHAARRIRHP